MTTRTRMVIDATALALLFAAPAFPEIVHTTSGDAIVGTIAARQDGALRIATLDGLVTVQGGEVASIREADELRRALGAEPRGSDWAGWLRRSEEALGAGLFEDALRAADRALVAIARAPARPRFEFPPRFFDLPLFGLAPGAPADEETARLLLAAVAGDEAPATALVARKRLQAIPRGEPLARAALAAVDADDPRVRAAAMVAISRCLPEDGLEPAIGRMLLDESASVREAARTAVRAYQHDGVVYPVARALQSAHPTVREAAMDAVEELRLTRAVGALVRNLARRVDTAGKTRGHMSNITHTSYVSDFDVEIAQSAVIGQPIVKVLQHGVVQDVAVAGVFARRLPRAERARIVSILSNLTGQDFGDDPDRWNAWLREQRRPANRDS